MVSVSVPRHDTSWQLSVNTSQESLACGLEVNELWQSSREGSNFMTSASILQGRTWSAASAYECLSHLRLLSSLLSISADLSELWKHVNDQDSRPDSHYDIFKSAFKIERDYDIRLIAG